MQLNNPKSNTSNLIKQSESAKKKARRRLIGSIFMLFTALIILLNVTTKVKPIPVTPKVIEISNNNASAAVKASAPIRQVAASSVNASQPLIANVTNASEPAGNGFRAGVLSRTEKTDASQTSSSNATVTATPIIITMNLGKKPSPADILNGVTTSTEETIYYIQIASSQNKSALQSMQNTLTNSSIKSYIQNGKNNTFRLRVGPFKNKADASEKLTQIQDSLNQ